MLIFIRAAAFAAMLSLMPANVALATNQAQVAVAAPTAPVPGAAPAQLTPKPELGLDKADTSGLAPGQTAADFKAWLGRSPANRPQLVAFRDYLAARGVEAVVPVWQLTRTSSSWRSCGAEPFEVPAADKWQRIVKTLNFVRDEVVPGAARSRHCPATATSSSTPARPERPRALTASSSRSTSRR